MKTTIEMTASKLADEIERRGLKFADLPPGKYEGLSLEETEMICRALRDQEKSCQCGLTAEGRCPVCLTVPS